MKKLTCLLLTAAIMLGCLFGIAETTIQWRFNDTIREIEADDLPKDIVGPIEVPSQVNGLDVHAVPYGEFSSLPNLVGITLPDTMAVFNRSVLSRLDSLTSIHLPEGLVVIMTDCLSGLKVLESLTIPASVSFINGSINKNPMMKSVTFEGVCPVIEDGGAVTLTGLAPDCVIYVPNDQVDAYKAALSLNEDTVSRIQPSGKNAVQIDWTAPESDFDFDPATGTISGYKGSASRVDIPAEIGGVPVKAVGEKTFFKNYSVCYVTVPEGVTFIAVNAFRSVYHLTYLDLPSTVTAIDTNACGGSAKLMAVRFPESLETIGSNAFSYTFLIDVKLPEGVREIGDRAFYSCKIKNLTIGPNVTKIGKEAFNSNRLEKVDIQMPTMPEMGEKVYANNPYSCVLTLPDGIEEELYVSYVDMMAAEIPKCVVEKPEIKASFPALDAALAAPFTGSWTGVYAFDGTDYYTTDLLGMTLTLSLSEDATGKFVMDGEVITGKWYVESNAALFGPSPEEVIPVIADENGRLSIDLGGIILILEKDGVAYDTPVVPARDWPELDLSNAKYFIGEWEAVSYIVEGETYPAELLGPMTVILNDDGTAAMLENGVDSGMPLRWYADYGMAYFGPTVEEAVSITFDGKGNIQLDMGGTTVLLAPKAEEVKIEGADEILGEWLDDIGNKLNVSSDGNLTVTYASDGYVRELKWNMVDGAPFVTEGIWEGCPITLENGILTISNGEGIYQLYSRDGDLSLDVAHIPASFDDFEGGWICTVDSSMQLLLLDSGATLISGDMSMPASFTIEDGVALIDDMKLYMQEDGTAILDMSGSLYTFERGYVEAPKAPAGNVSADGEAFIGEWTLVSMAGMDPAMFGFTMTLTLNADGTCVMFDGAASDTGYWTYENGTAIVAEAAVTINNEGQLVMSDQGMDMVFEKTGGASAPAGASGEALSAFEGTWHMVYCATGGLTGDLRAFGITGALTLNPDGTGIMTGISDEQGPWGDDEGIVRFGEAGSPLQILSDGFLCLGTEMSGYMIFSRDASAVWTPAPIPAPGMSDAPAPAEPAPAVSPAPAGNVQHVGVKFVCKTYTTFGQTMDASMLGAEYGLMFHDNGTADFTMAGFTVPSLPYTVTADGVYQINYYGTMFNCTATDAGFDMDYYGTMTMHFVPAE